MQLELQARSIGEGSGGGGTSPPYYFSQQTFFSNLNIENLILKDLYKLNTGSKSGMYHHF